MAYHGILCPPWEICPEETVIAPLVVNFLVRPQRVSNADRFHESMLSGIEPRDTGDAIILLLPKQTTRNVNFRVRLLKNTDDTNFKYFLPRFYLLLAPHNRVDLTLDMTRDEVWRPLNAFPGRRRASNATATHWGLLPCTRYHHTRQMQTRDIIFRWIFLIFGNLRRSLVLLR